MKKVLLILIILLLVCSTVAIAQVDNSSVLNNVINNFANSASLWENSIKEKAKWLFWALATISLAVTFAYMAMDGVELQKAASEVVRWIVGVGFFAYLLEEGPYLAGVMIDGLVLTGSQAASGAGFAITSPSDIMDVGYRVFDQIIDGMSVLSPAKSIISAIIAILVMMSMALVAVNLVLEYCTAYILIYAGVFVLGFGSTQWFRDMVLQYFKTILGCGLRIMTLILIVGIGADIIAAANISQSPSIKECASLLITALMILILTNRVPNIIGSLSGGISMGEPIRGGALLAAAGGMGAAAGVIKSMSGGILAEGKGTFEAVKSAASKAHQTISQSGSITVGGLSGGGGFGERAGTVLGTGGKYLTETLKNLQAGRQGVKQDQKQAGLSQTFGGQVSDKIQNK